MPDRHNWTAAMVLKWILTRDAEAVLAMAADYGAVVVNLETRTSTEVRPATMADVDRAFVIDESITDREERITQAVIRAELRVIPARHEIHDALRQGRFEARSRRNGRGDLVTIESDQWLLLKIDSIAGHDLAVPVDLNQKPLPLQYSLDDYLAARVPIDATPTLWPDPLFRANQTEDLWPDNKAHSANQASETTPAARPGTASDQGEETTADRNLRWYNDFGQRSQSRKYGTNEAIFDAMSLDFFGHKGKTATVKKAVNGIRAQRGETGRRFLKPTRPSY
jgi:hypothetical protein